MKKNNLSPKYCTVLYGLMKKLSVSVVEYAYLDMVYQLSRRTWCYKSLQNIADDLGMSKAGMHDIKRRMLERGYIEENAKHHVRTSEKYDSLQLDEWSFVRESYDKIKNRSKSVLNRSNIEQNRSKSVPKNNNRTTKNINGGYFCFKHKDNYVPSGKVCGYC